MDDLDRTPLFTAPTGNVSPDIVNKLVLRIRALTLQLLPVQVSLDSLRDPTSRIITTHVVDAYAAAAGDFLEAFPFALLRAKRTFSKDAKSNIADWDENMGRATACEVIARRIVHKLGPDRLQSVMSTRYRYREPNGDISNPASAFEYAVDDGCTIFLSSNESQMAMYSLWGGKWVQKYTGDNIEYVPYDDIRKGGFWGHLDSSRLSVPRYQNIFRILIWCFFLFVYSQAVRQPLIGKQTNHQNMDIWEYLLYIMSFAFAFEEAHKFYSNVRLFSWRAGIASFWTVISLITLSILTAAFTVRLIGIFGHDPDGKRHLLSFQILSCVAPLIWMRLITVFDGMKYIGTMQICVGSMLQESTIFFALLALLFVGFLQAMIALDASDGEYERSTIIVNSLVQALLQAPDFEKSQTNTFGLVIYYFWNFATSVILLNILVSLFASAYDSVTDDAEAEFLSFFAGKTIAMIRAPDEFVYPSPFNLVEIFLVAPLEPCLSPKTYAKINEKVMMVLFFIPLSIIALYESMMDGRSNYFRDWFARSDGEDENSDAAQNPQVTDSDMKISKVPFHELIKVFPNTSMSPDEIILDEIRALRRKVDELSAKVHG